MNVSSIDFADAAAPLVGARVKPDILDVASQNFCVGCGSCSSVAGASVRMVRTPLGTYQPDFTELDTEQLTRVDGVCPFSQNAPDEEEMGQSLFGAEKFQHHPQIGFFNGLRAGRVLDTRQLHKSSSGGLTTFLLCRLIESNVIDGVIHVGDAARDGLEKIASYRVSHSVAEVREHTKSRYCSVHFETAINQIRGNGKRYAFVGTACFIKAMRLLTKHDSDLRHQIVFHVGLICGHLKSIAFAESLSWQMGVMPDAVRSFDFRVKLDGKPASQYAVAVTQEGTDSQTIEQPTANLVGTNWGHSAFQLNACNACDDVLTELADISFGDAWLPRFDQDPQGTNIVIIRSTELLAILDGAEAAGEIWLDELTTTEVIQSQAGNFRHRQTGMRLRQLHAQAHGRWFPIKPRSPKYGVDVGIVRMIQSRLREKMAAASHESFLHAKSVGNLTLYLNKMRPQINQMTHVNKWLYRTEQGRFSWLLGSVVRSIGSVYLYSLMLLQKFWRFR